MQKKFEKEVEKTKILSFYNENNLAGLINYVLSFHKNQKNQFLNINLEILEKKNNYLFVLLYKMCDKIENIDEFYEILKNNLKSGKSIEFKKYKLTKDITISELEKNLIKLILKKDEINTIKYLDLLYRKSKEDFYKFLTEFITIDINLQDVALSLFLMPKILEKIGSKKNYYNILYVFVQILVNHHIEFLQYAKNYNLIKSKIIINNEINNKRKQFMTLTLENIQDAKEYLLEKVNNCCKKNNLKINNFVAYVMLLNKINITNKNIIQMQAKYIISHDYLEKLCESKIDVNNEEKFYSTIIYDLIVK